MQLFYFCFFHSLHFTIGILHTMLVLFFILYWHIDILEKTRDFAPNIWKLSHSTLPFLGLPNPSPSTSQFLCPCMKFSSFFPASVLCRLYIPGEASGAESIISMLHATTTQWAMKNMSTTTQIWVIITQSKDLFKGFCMLTFQKKYLSQNCTFLVWAHYAPPRKWSLNDYENITLQRLISKLPALVLVPVLKKKSYLLC